MSYFWGTYTLSSSVIDFLGFDFDSFYNPPNDLDAPVASPTFPILTEEQWAAFEAHCDKRSRKPRIKCTPTGFHFIRRNLLIHETPSVYFNICLSIYNDKRTDKRDPLACTGRAEMRINGFRYDPDTSFTVCPRDSPNIVFETNYLDGETVADFHARLRYLISGTPGIMIVVGVKIYTRLPNFQDFAGVVVVYERDGNNLPHIPQHSHVSFGTVPLSAEELCEWNSAINAPMNGEIRIEVPEMTEICFRPQIVDDPAPAPYLLPLREDLLLASNSDVNNLIYRENWHPVLPNNLYLDCNLYRLQQLILQRIPLLSKELSEQYRQLQHDYDLRMNSLET